MTTETPRTWRVVIHEWEEFELRVEASSKEEAETRALESYDHIHSIDHGIDWVDAGEEE